MTSPATGPSKMILQYVLARGRGRSSSVILSKIYLYFLSFCPSRRRPFRLKLNRFCASDRELHRGSSWNTLWQKSVTLMLDGVFRPRCRAAKHRQWVLAISGGGSPRGSTDAVGFLTTILGKKRYAPRPFRGPMSSECIGWKLRAAHRRSAQDFHQGRVGILRRDRSEGCIGHDGAPGYSRPDVDHLGAGIAADNCWLTPPRTEIELGRIECRLQNAGSGTSGDGGLRSPP